MPSLLPISLDSLLRLERVESARVEFKGPWDEATRSAVLRTLCAFANDLLNINGGYIILGVDEQTQTDAQGKIKPLGLAELPPRGLAPEQLDAVQKWIRGKCKGLVTPEYHPILSPEVYQGRHILVIWAPASESPPHQTVEWVPEDWPGRGAPSRHYYVRQGSETTVAQGRTLQDLVEKSRRIPYDDQRRLEASLDDLRFVRVREFLQEVGSQLLSEPDAALVYRSMNLSARVNGHEVPRNVALLFFTDEPERFFPTAHIEVVQFRDPEGGDTIGEHPPFRGPLDHQLRDCLRYLRQFLSEEIRKHPEQAETTRVISYPFAAIEEALVNAVYHRSYEYTEQSAPVKVYLYPDRIEITSHPGPHPGLRAEHFEPGASRPQVPARNRRIGEILRELRLAEGRFTGIAKVFRTMRENGLPQPRFLFGEDRSYFTVVLPAHPEYVALSAIRDAAYLEAIGQTAAARERLLKTFEQVPQSTALASYLMRQLTRDRRLDPVEDVFKRHEQAHGPAEKNVLYAMILNYLEHGRTKDAGPLIQRLPPPPTSTPDAMIKQAVLLRRARREREAHDLFEKARPAVLNDTQALLEFAQCKLALARRFSAQKGPEVAGTPSIERETRRRFQREARELLRHVLQLRASPQHEALAWLELARVERALGEPRSQIEHALGEAERLGGGEPELRQRIEKQRALAARSSRERRS